MSEIRETATARLIVKRGEIDCACCRPKPHAYCFWGEMVPARPRFDRQNATLSDWLHENLSAWVHADGTPDEASIEITIRIAPKRGKCFRGLSDCDCQ